MKKFVSIVLALALALSLCTVAFAAKVTDLDYEWETLELDDDHTYFLLTASNGKLAEGAKLDKDICHGDTIKSVEASVTKENDKVVKASIAYKELIGAGRFYRDTVKYVEVDAADADAVLFKDGEVFAYVAIVDYVEYTETGAKFTNYSDKCGYYSEDDNTYYALDGKTGLYVKSNSGDVYALVGDVVLRLAKSEKKVNAHNYEADTTVTKVGGKEKLTVTRVYCTKCDKEFAFETDYTVATKVFGKNNFKQLEVTIGTGDDVLSKVVYIAMDDAAVATNNTKTNTSTTVDSSKTFDAGVATYAVLSLASVAGSAVVIGKKKEF